MTSHTPEQRPLHWSCQRSACGSLGIYLRTSASDCPLLLEHNTTVSLVEKRTHMQFINAFQECAWVRH